MTKKKPFTAEQVEILNQNPYTHRASEMSITFTLEFKIFFYEQTMIPGMTARKILDKAGYDNSWFSKANIDQLRRRILAEAASPKGFKPPRGLSSKERTAQFAAQDLARQKTDTSIRQLQERIVHLEQQIEFLKKTSRLLH